MTTIRKDVRLVRDGDRFLWGFGDCAGQMHGNREREIVRVRSILIQLYRVTGHNSAAQPVDKILGVEILHRSPHRPGVDYLEAPHGSQLAILIP